MSSWHPSDLDATSLAALHWFALTIEKTAIEVYVTDRTRYESIETKLRDAITQLNALRPAILIDECPPGYVECDGACVPMCDGETQS